VLEGELPYDLIRSAYIEAYESETNLKSSHIGDD
jgi:hypothetical protein